MSEPGKWVELNQGFEDVVGRVQAALAAEGFGLITQIDMKETLKAKLNVEFRKYKILGACNPAFARRALEQNLRIGLHLPCNVVVHEIDDKRTSVGFIDPITVLGLADSSEALKQIAGEVGERLDRVRIAVSGA
ncbi:MAG: DUF302 domain-containing protein [Polyangiaceae bacterium]